METLYLHRMIQPPTVFLFLLTVPFFCFFRFLWAKSPFSPTMPECEYKILIVGGYIFEFRQLDYIFGLRGIKNPCRQICKKYYTYCSENTLSKYFTIFEHILASSTYYLAKCNPHPFGLGGLSSEIVIFRSPYCQKMSFSQPTWGIRIWILPPFENDLILKTIISFSML